MYRAKVRGEGLPVHNGLGFRDAASFSGMPRAGRAAEVEETATDVDSAESGQLQTQQYTRRWTAHDFAESAAR